MMARYSSLSLRNQKLFWHHQYFMFIFSKFIIMAVFWIHITVFMVQKKTSWYHMIRKFLQRYAIHVFYDKKTLKLSSRPSTLVGMTVRFQGTFRRLRPSTLGLNQYTKINLNLILKNRKNFFA